MKLKFKAKSRVGGLFHFVDVLGVDGSVKQTIGPFPNLVTNSGMDLIGSNVADWMTTFKWGRGTTTPSFTDTALVDQIGQISATTLNTSGNYSSAPYGAWRQRTWITDPFAANEIVGEIGIGTTTALLARVLPKDGSGNPITVTVLQGERLRGSYRFNWMAPTADNVEVINLNITDPVSTVATTVTTRACSVATPGAGGWSVPKASNDTSAIIAYNGSIGSVTGTPSGTTSNIGTAAVTFSPYVLGSFKRAYTVLAGPTVGNLTGGISALRATGGCGTFQVGLSPAVQKTDLYRIEFDFEFYWERL